MPSVLLCTGKKKRIQAISEYYQQQQKQKKLSILSVKITTKRALFWHYDELKMLFEAHDKSDGRAPDKLLQALDSHAYRKGAMVLAEFKSPRVADDMIKVKALTICHGYVARGVRSKVDMREHKETEYRKFYQCSIQLQGPAEGVLSCKQDLLADNLCDDKTVAFVF